MESDKYYSVSEIAEIISKSNDTVRQYLKSGKLVGKKSVVNGEWSATGLAIQAFMEGESIAESRKTVNWLDSDPDVKASEKRRRIAENDKVVMELEAKKAGFNTAEEFIQAGIKFQEDKENLDTIIAEGIAEGLDVKENKLLEAIEKAERAEKAFNEKADRYEPMLKEATEKMKEAGEYIKELEERLQLEAKEAERIKEENNYYTNHRQKGIDILRQTAKAMKPYTHTKLSSYLLGQADGLENISDAEEGTRVFQACSRSIIKIASYYENNARQLKDCDAEAILDYLLDKSAKLDKVMRLPDERDATLPEGMTEETMYSMNSIRR